jgi:putative hemolysin
MRMVSIIAGPVVSLLSLSTDGVLRVFRLSTKSDTTVTEEEVRIMIAEGAKTGVFDEAEREIVESVFRLADRRVGELMIPRPRMLWLDAEDPLHENLQRIASTSHSFYPVAHGDLDQLAGVVSTKHLCGRLLAGEQPDLTSDLLAPTFVPETMTVLQLLDLFRTVSPHVAIVVDEHGSIVGLVTPSDILEAMVGDLAEAETDSHPQVTRRTDGSWLVDGLLPLEELDELFGVGNLEEEADEGVRVRSVGGLVMHRLGRIPVAGDRVTWHGMSFEVMDMDSRRVDTVLVEPVAAALADTADAAPAAAPSDEASPADTDPGGRH